MPMPTAAERERRSADVADRRRDFELNPIQYDFVYDDAHKYCAYIGGLGAGKSFAGGLKAMRKATEFPGSLGMIGAPNYPQLRDSTMRSFFEDICPPRLIRDRNKTEGIVRLKNGSEILFRSMDDPENRRGPNLTWFWLDEGPLCGYYAWQIMKGRLRQAGFTDVTQGWITGTPHGEDEFYEDFENEPKPSHMLYRASTRENLHNLPGTYIEDLGYTGNFALQEIEGLFVNFEGLVYELRKEWHFGEWIDQRVDGHPHTPALRIGGVDWGYTNPAVALPIWVDGDDRAFVRDEFYQSRVGLAGIEQACVDYSRRYGITHWYCGPDEPEHIDALNIRFGREGIAARAVAADDDINAGIETVRRLMQPRGDDTTGFKLSARCVNLRAEMRTYCYGTKNGAKRDPQEKPIKKMDHACDAVRYALHSALGAQHRAVRLPAKAYERLRMPAKERMIGGVTILRKEF